MTTHQDTSAEHDLVSNMRALEADHEPDGWPAVRMSTISHLCDVIERLRAALASRDEAAVPSKSADYWDGAEEWMPLAYALCADECGEEACHELVWEGGPIPEPWGDRYLKYEDEAKRLIKLVREHVPAAQQPQVQAVSDEEIEKLAMKAGAQHDCMDRLCLKGIDEIKRFRAILALRPDHFPGATKMMPLSDDFATIAGLESAVGHLSTLVDEQRALLVESEDVFGRDGHGGRYEDGECNLIDRIRAHLEMTAPPPNGTTAKEQGK